MGGARAPTRAGLPGGGLVDGEGGLGCPICLDLRRGAVGTGDGHSFRRDGRGEARGRWAGVPEGGTRGGAGPLCADGARAVARVQAAALIQGK